MQLNLPDVPPIYNIYKLSFDDQKRDTVESASWIEKALPEINNFILDYKAAVATLNSELSRIELVRQYIENHDMANRLQRITSCQK